jgi:hypothetical protein
MAIPTLTPEVIRGALEKWRARYGTAPRSEIDVNVLESIDRRGFDPWATISLTEFAASQGVTVGAVSNACRSGRLEKAVVWSEDHTRVVGVIPDLAASEWSTNRDPAHADQAPPSPGESGSEDLETSELGPAAQAKIRSLTAQARLHELKLVKEARQVVPLNEMVDGAGRMIVAFKTATLSIPSRFKQAVPHLTIDEMKTLEDLIRETLTHLNEWSPK